MICYSEFHGRGRSYGRNNYKLNGTLTYNMYSFRGEGSWCLVADREVLTGCVSFIGFAAKSAWVCGVHVQYKRGYVFSAASGLAN